MTKTGWRIAAAAVLIVAGCVVLAGCRDDDEGATTGAGVLDGLARPQQGRSMRATSTMRVGELRRGPDGDRDAGERRYDPAAEPRGDADVKSNWDNFNVPAGATHVLMDAEGPGAITHIWLTFLGPEPQGWAAQGSAGHQELLLRMYWDGADKPAVEAPVGDFFANCFGVRSEVVSEPVVVEGGDSYNCFWRMPFRKSARIEIVNQSDKPLSLLYYNIDWIKLDRLADDTPYFHAQYRQEYPAANGRDYVLLETEGKGHFVGAVLGVRMRSPAWFGEGDEKIFIDGEARPSIWGTGTEDYFLAAWGLERSRTPYFGVPFFDYRTIGGHVSSYRWHLHDPVVFNTSIKVTLEHMGWMSEDENPDYKATSWNEREDDYASVAFWYQTGPSTFAARAPGGAERRLPDLARMSVRAWDPAAPRRHGAGDAARDVDGATGRDILSYKPGQVLGAWIEFPVEVAVKEPLRLEVAGMTAPDGGLFQAYLDGVKIGEPLDFHGPAGTAAVFPLLDFWPEPGPHVLRLAGVGKSAASEGYGCAVDAVRLLERRPRVAAMAHDRDKDWKKDPKLYY